MPEQEWSNQVTLQNVESIFQALINLLDGRDTKVTMHWEANNSDTDRNSYISRIDLLSPWKDSSNAEEKAQKGNWRVLIIDEDECLTLKFTITENPESNPTITLRKGYVEFRHVNDRGEKYTWSATVTSAKRTIELTLKNVERYGAAIVAALKGVRFDSILVNEKEPAFFKAQTSNYETSITPNMQLNDPSLIVNATENGWYLLLPGTNERLVVTDGWQNSHAVVTFGDKYIQIEFKKDPRKEFIWIATLHPLS